MNTCPACGIQLDLPSEVLRGIVTGVCGGCGARVGPGAEKQQAWAPDLRGQPSIPGGAK